MAKGKKGKLRSIRIEAAHNGYNIHTDHAHPQTNGPHEPDADDQLPHVATSREAALSHISQLMAAHEGQEPDADDQPPQTGSGRMGLRNALRGGR